MKILGIETSCDETALAIVDASGGLKSPSFKVLGSALISQINVHKEYGGVFPSLAKREHSRNLIPLLEEVLKKSKLLKRNLKGAFDQKTKDTLAEMLSHEPDLLTAFLEFIPTTKKPEIDAISVTSGPGLEPALWVGVNFAKALGYVWNLPIQPSNHMEGHVVASLLHTKSFNRKSRLKPLAFPALALLISGGHTQLVLMKDWMKYQIIGQTRDDAVGEAFDKVARMLDLPYPGGPEISKLATKDRTHHPESLENYKLPRPMLNSKDFDFSFSGLKTAVLYTLKKIPDITDEIKREIAREFEDSATEVLLAKTTRALHTYHIKTLILGGGVTANTFIKKSFGEALKKFPKTVLYLPEVSLSTDNAIMIALASYFNLLKKPKGSKTFKADGNLTW